MERSKQGVEKAADAVRKAQLEAYWDNGRYIVEYEQNGKKHAEYGLELLKKLAVDLTLRLGKGYSRPTLYKMRKFYQCYPKGFEECAYIEEAKEKCIGNKVYWCDLVFYHRILKCFVLIDLKKDDVQHDDIGQIKKNLNV